MFEDDNARDHARTLHIEDQYGIEVGKPGDCILLNGQDHQALNQHAEVLPRSIRHGRVLAQTKAGRDDDPLKLGAFGNDAADPLNDLMVSGFF